MTNVCWATYPLTPGWTGRPTFTPAAVNNMFSSNVQIMGNPVKYVESDLGHESLSMVHSMAASGEGGAAFAVCTLH